MLHSRMISILQELMSTSSTVTSEHLANINQVTSRTVRNDMKELDRLLSEHGAAIHSVRGTGYELKIFDDRSFYKLLKEETHFFNRGIIPTLPEERTQYLIRRLLLADQYIKLEDLADELYVSKSTVQNDLREIKKTFQNYGVVLEKRPNYGLKAKGNELKLRYCMSEHIFNRREVKSNLFDERISILPSDEISAIRHHILEHIKATHITLSDIGLNNLIIHIAIACKRIRNENYVSIYPDDLKDIVKQKEYEVAVQIVKSIEDDLHLVFPEAETAYIAIHLLGTKLASYTSEKELELQSFIGQDIYDLTSIILETIENELKLDIKNDQELLTGLSLHLKPAINRYRYEMNLRNPMLDEIKANYPLAFEAGILAGMVLKEKLGIEMHENEIGYLALHIGGAIERKKISNKPKRCIIVCASGAGSARLLHYKLKSKFGSSLTILGTTPYYKLNQMSLDSLDFIVSTIPISEALPLPVIEVNTILGGNDLDKVESFIHKIEDKPFEYTKEELVFLQQTFDTRDEVLNFLGEQLEQLGLVSEAFIDSVFEREAVSPTCFGNLTAIPHPIMPQSDTTFWAICTLQKPIEWADKRVQFVCLLSVEKNTDTDLQHMYDLLGGIIDDVSLVKRLLKCKTYPEFISMFQKKQSCV
ncbi:BglG family transcription antiterminator [Bacillus gobiensis]|uniref:BglG family transcription antiterminator n=1 Tax=Bacillus gobiensis TaxID=1441095 RepID=UPI003D1F5519